MDVGEGAHDDGAGIVHSIEALRILKALNYQNKHTLRVVLFMNEENGNFGGKSYAKLRVKRRKSTFVLLNLTGAVFYRLVLRFVGDSSQVQFIQSFYDALDPFEIYKLKKGWGGVDIAPLLDYYPDMLQMGYQSVHNGT